MVSLFIVIRRSCGTISVFPHTKASITAWCKKTYWSYTKTKSIPVLLRQAVFDRAKFKKFLIVKINHLRLTSSASSLPTKTWPFLGVILRQMKSSETGCRLNLSRYQLLTCWIWLFHITYLFIHKSWVLQTFFIKLVIFRDISIRIKSSGMTVFSKVV